MGENIQSHLTLALTLAPCAKAAVTFLRLNAASRKIILAQLTDGEIKRLFDAIGDIGTLEAHHAQIISDEFLSFLENERAIIGETTLAQNMLYESLEEARVKAILGETLSPFERLNALPEPLLVAQFQKERPQVIALILSRLEESKAANLLASFDLAYASDILIASLQAQPLNGKTLELMSNSLEKTLLARLEANHKNDTITRLTRLIEAQDAPHARALLATLEQSDRSAAQAIAQKLFTFAHLEWLSARDLTLLLNAAGHVLVAQCLAPLDEEKQKFFLHHVSGTAAEYILDEMEMVRPNPQAQRSLITLARKIADQGEITLNYAL
jgi:flagellar motor switch protein FliG